jgi:LPS-assembly protein
MQQRFRTLLLLVVLGTLFALPARAQELGLKLKLQPELIPYSNEDEDTPLFVEADRIQGHQGGAMEAEGSARLRKRGAAVFADHLYFAFPNQELSARGNLRFEFRGNVVKGESMTYNVRDESGVIEKPEYYIFDLDAHGSAERMVAENRDKFRVDKASYTNCEVGDDDWFLKADRLDLDRARDLGVARNATLVFKGVPLIYSPYLDFSLSGSRKSGLLPPSIGQTAKSGFEMTIPYYFNIAPNYDATLAPRLLARRGVLLNTEFRYLEPGFNGELRGEYLPDDRLFQESRYGYSAQHRQDFGYGFTGGLNLQGVSDDFYFTDLSDKIAVTSQTNLPREGNLAYNGGWWNANARVQTFQTLQDPLAPVVPPYERVPQLTLLGTRPTALGVDFGVRGELVEFQHPTRINGRRDTLYPSLSLPLKTSYFYLTPKAGYHYTRYTLEESRSGITREVPIYSVDSAVTFERDTEFFGNGFTQTLEPRLYYVYIPFRPQSQIPNFDTAVSDFNLAQIFTENQFSGGDRINDADQLTAALTSRLVRPSDGSEQLRVTLAQRYYFSDQKVTLDPSFVPRSSNRSDILAGVSGALTPQWSAEALAQYSMVEDQTERANFTVQYRPDVGKVMNFGYRFTRDSLEQVDWSAQWPITSKWSGVARWNYSTRDKRVIEGLAGLEYNAGCWVTRMVAHRFVSATDEYTTSFFLQLELTGVSRVGLNPLDTLRQNISGYTKSNESPRNERSPFPNY